MKHYDFCIIGAGVVGSGIARELSKYNISIAVLDQANDVAMGCTKANSGILHGGYDSKYGTLKAKLEYRGNRLYTQWNEELQFGIDRCGSYVVAFSDTELDALKNLQQNGVQNGVSDLSFVSKEKMLDLEPNINPNIAGALQCKHSGVISPYEVAIALAENAVTNGVDYFLQTRVNSIIPIESDGTAHVWRIETEHESFQTRYLINSAGVYADEIAAMAGVSTYSISPRQGSYYVFRFGYMPINHVLFQAPTEKGKGVLVAPTYHGNLLIGPDATAVSDKDDTQPTAKSLEYIYQAARRTIPSLDLKQAIRTFAGIRPTAHNRDFTIRMDKANLINLVGIDSPGLTSAPAIAEYVINLLQSTSCSLQLKTDYTPKRTSFIKRQSSRAIDNNSTNHFLPMKEIAKLTALPEGDPNRIVCRCEQVREGTITTALERNPQCTSIDAVKRRTRASMGICQGQYCRPQIRKLLAKKYSIDQRTISEK